MHDMTLGSVTGNPYNNPFMPYPWHPPQSIRIFEHQGVPRLLRQHLHRILWIRVQGGRAIQLLPDGGTGLLVYFTHGDLLPHNILVDGSTITAIIDWETAGFYPEFWECCRMHDPGWMTPAWARVLARIFPSPRREGDQSCISDPS